MSDRIELNEQALESVVGGAFRYSTKPDGSMVCKVDGAGTYNCTATAKNKISVYILQHDNCTLDDIINYATSNGLFW